MFFEIEKIVFKIMTALLNAIDKNGLDDYKMHLQNPCKKSCGIEKIMILSY